MNAWIVTVLIFLPVAAALVIWLVPMRRFTLGAFATLAAVTEIGFWIVSLIPFDFGEQSGRLQLERRWSWFSDLGVSYHVAVYPFAVWLVGLTVIVMAASIAYGWWAGRERPRAY